MTGAAALAGPFAMWALLFGAGLVVQWLAGYGTPVTRMLLAVPVSTAVLACLGLVQMIIPFDFRLQTAAAALGGTILGALGLRLMSRVARRTSDKRKEDCQEADPRLVLLMLAITAALSATVLHSATGGDLGVASQTWDAIFDANATRSAFETGTISPSRIADFSHFEPLRTWYPSFFHTLGALVMSVFGVDAVVATNVAAVIVAGGLWPSLATLAVRYTLGYRRPVTLGGLAMSWGFVGMPWIPLGWGVLWATATAGTAVMFVVLGWAGVLGLVPSKPTRLRSVVVFVTGVLATGLLHPRVLALGGVLCVGLWSIHFGLKAAAARTLGWSAAMRWLLVGVLPLVPMIPMLLLFGRGESAVTSRLWPVARGPGAEIFGYLVSGPLGTTPLIVPGAVALCGALIGWRRRDLRWLVLLLVLAVGLDIVTAVAQHWRPWAGLARFWYGDRHRTAILPPFMFVILSCVAIARLASIGRSTIGNRIAVSVAVLASLATVCAGAMGAARYLQDFYVVAAADPERSLVSERERAFYRDVAGIVPPNARILNNANDGSALLYAYTGRRPVFLLAGIRASTRHGETLRESLVTRPPADLCALARSDGVEWVLNGGRPYASLEVDRFNAPGMRIPDGFWATTEVLRDGDLSLHRITACFPDP